MQVNEELLEAKAQFTKVWLKYAGEQADVMDAGDWVHVFAVLQGTAMAMAEVPAETAGNVMDEVKKVALGSYGQTHEHLSSPMQ